MEYYDIAFPMENPHYRDTLLNPPDYKNKWIITNPPYLAKNKAKDKTAFNLYDYDDLYKIAMSTFSQANGGILVIPINFFTDEKSKKIRKEFLKNFKVLRLNIYLDQVFDSTTYNVCSFAFIKENNIKQDVPVFVYKNNQLEKNAVFSIQEDSNYRIGGYFFKELKEVKNIFSRITVNNRENPTNIFITCVDKIGEPLHFSFEEPYYGKQSDRNIATLSTSISLTEEQQKSLIEIANNIITKFRRDTLDLSFTNFRDRSRKRIGFTEAYQIMSLAYYTLINQEKA